MTRPAVFFDRDGTLMEDVPYCGDPAKVKLLPGVPEALRQLKQAGFLNIVITNQSGIGRGLITERQYHAVHQEFLRQIGPGSIDATYYCPDPPWVPSARRKPAAGMLLEAAADFAIDLNTSYFVGDKKTDIECGRKTGATAILVLTGHGRGLQDATPDYTAKSIVQATQIVLGRATVSLDTTHSGK